MPSFYFVLSIFLFGVCSLGIMAENKLELYLTEGNARAKNVLVRVTTSKLTKGNYMQWSIAIMNGIAGRGRFGNINGRKLPPLENDSLWET